MDYEEAVQRHEEIERKYVNKKRNNRRFLGIGSLVTATAICIASVIYSIRVGIDESRYMPEVPWAVAGLVLIGASVRGSYNERKFELLEDIEHMKISNAQMLEIAQRRNLEGALMGEEQ